MLHLRELGLLDLTALTATGEPLEKSLAWWEKSDRRRVLREMLHERDRIDPDDVIMSPARAKSKGLTSTVCFPRGNLAPEGSVIKSTAIDPCTIDADRVYRKVGPARVFYTERDAIAAVKAQTDRPIKPGDVLVLCCRGPMGSGMEETYQITSALKHLECGREVAVLTDARFSGVSTGPCIGHVGPEALAGGPIGKIRDGDLIRIIIDCEGLVGSVDLVGVTDPETGAIVEFGPDQGTRVLAERPTPDWLRADPRFPTTRGSGRRFKRPAAAPGPAAFTTSIGFLKRWPPVRPRSPERIHAGDDLQS